jgi:hypothetical protein
LHLGGEIWLSRHFGLAPEATIDGGPFIGRHSSGITTGRFGFASGLRLLFGFSHGHAFFLRYLIGGEVLLFGPGGRLGSGATDLGFATEPGLGMQFRIARHAVIGFILGTPIGIHSYRTANNEINVDFAGSVFIGLRR